MYLCVFLLTQTARLFEITISIVCRRCVVFSWRISHEFVEKQQQIIDAQLELRQTTIYYRSQRETHSQRFERIQRAQWRQKHQQWIDDVNLKKIKW